MRNIAAIGTALALSLASCSKKKDPESEPPEFRLPKIEKSEDPSPAPSKPQMYIIRKGDTLSGISRQFGVSVQELAEVNNIKNPKMLVIGAKLLIPADLPAPGPDKKFQPDQKPDKKPDNSDDLFERVVKGNVPVLKVQHMPPEVRKHLAAMNDGIRNYAISEKLGLMGPPLCGQGSCDAFSSAKSGIGHLSELDSVFTNPAFYLLKYGSNSRDAFKIRETLDTLASMPESGWVRVAIRGFPQNKGTVVRHKKEGVMFLPSGLPGGTLLCYDPDPATKEKGRGGAAWGHIEWVTKDNNGQSWYVHAVHSEVHGGSEFCRGQYDKMMKNGNLITCYAYILTTPAIKERWLMNQLSAESGT